LGPRSEWSGYSERPEARGRNPPSKSLHTFTIDDDDADARMHVCCARRLVGGTTPFVLTHMSTPEYTDPAREGRAAATPGDRRTEGKEQQQQRRLCDFGRQGTRMFLLDWVYNVLASLGTWVHVCVCVCACMCVCVFGSAAAQAKHVCRALLRANAGSDPRGLIVEHWGRWIDRRTDQAIDHK
jgi:hypothetical protein